MTAFDELANEWISATLEHRPTGATSMGFHERDGELGDRGREAIEGRARTLRGFLRRAEALAESSLSAEERREAELLKRRMQWELVDSEELQPWRRSPGSYLGQIGGGLNGLIIRKFAPLDERGRSVASRLRQVRRLLEQAKENLEACERTHVETAIEQSAGLKMLLGQNIPEALSEVGDTSLRSDIDGALADATSALESFASWMRDDLLPKANDDFAYGMERFKKLLSYVDFVDQPLDELEKRGRDDLAATQARLKQLCAQVDASKSATEVVDEISRDHPSPDRLLADTDALLEELRQFSIDRRLATMPTDVRIRVADTPSFARMTIQAACSTPGAFETKATEAYYYVTPPEASWPAERTEAYLKFFNRYSIPGVTAHEAYPGHYVHISWLHKNERKLPHFLMTTTTVEGWAHYVEQAFVEAGYGDGDPRYEIMECREALMRLCRYLASIGLHTQGWTIEQSVAFFEDEGYATKPIADRETRRGVMGPGYYAYTLGKHQILSLRDKLRAKQGSSFDQLAFHDAFMKLPYPVAMIEEIMVGG